MKTTGFAGRLAMSVAVVSMTIGASPAMAVKAAAIEKQQIARPVTDVSLADNGVFRGQIVAANGQPVAGTAVVLKKNNQVVATTLSDESGAFAFGGVDGGSYTVTAAGTSAAYRLWAPQTAPPVAQSAALLVNRGEIIRGQIGSGSILAGALLGGVIYGVYEIMDSDDGS
ncbi:MAG: carboxypeptidase regulatory-like domain-containing protein [Planctomycetota bacterium]|nr:MAG: carboxypeptidase regulatory-like domain-containing protein [Planctomycetota bacterium]REJ93658.1 MAG: carboxypeptidase regulatory-like domain-containing protein [Planctomycetota bacterium]REK25707.1 MAG: carboxypeptidase regulatory-like domain-containing protein [Planctomycetota bacterium]REK46547.1 MAG: carboxypeptidase regulatory-like domain-containing protein [Planctomycetota bacterium]